MTRARFTLWQIGLLLPGGLLMTWVIVSSAGALPGIWHFTLFDDAMISMSYGRTLAETGEWVWLPGAPRVQGFTNPLWSLVMAVIHWVGLSGSTAALAVSLISAVTVLGSALVTGRLIRLVSTAQESTIWALAATATVPLLFPLTFWALRGMEVGLLALCAIVILASIVAGAREVTFQASVRPFALLAVAAFTGVLTRADFVVIPIALTIAVLATRSRHQFHNRLKYLIGSGIVVPIAALAGTLIFQSLYWGSALPNTYYLKMTGFDVWTRLERGLLADGKLLPLLTLAVTGLLCVRRLSMERRERLTAGLAGVGVLVAVAYSTWVGGDAWETFKMANRYVAVVMPLAVVPVFLGAALGAARLHSIRTLSWVAAGAVAATAGLFVGVETNPPRMNLPVSAACVITLAALVLMARLTVRLSREHPRLAAGSLAAITGALLVAATGMPRIPISVAVGSGPDAVSDAEMTQRGLWIQEMTSPVAVVASLWAGAPVYYAERNALDLLGKSDEYLARKKPNEVADPATWNADFFPGHNKWDNKYSILDPRPDIVLNFLGTAGDERRLLTAGYEWFCFPDGYRYLVLADSPRVDHHFLARCPDSP